MSRQPKLLEGDVIDVPRADEVDAKIRRLESDLRSARLETDQARNELETAQAALQALRQVLMPLHRSLKAVFGEIEMAVGEDASPSINTHAATPNGMDPRVSAVWNSWKEKLGESPAAIIDALMVHGEANTAQLTVICKRARQTIADSIYKLNKAGLLNKNGGRFSLKQI